jgi:hypothetical protein
MAERVGMAVGRRTARSRALAVAVVARFPRGAEPQPGVAVAVLARLSWAVAHSTPLDQATLDRLLSART